jgi:hypothetical protein
MVLRANKDTTIFSVEGNPKSAAAAPIVLAEAGISSERARVRFAMSTDDNLADCIVSEGPYDVMLSELVGFLASSEGLICVLSDFQQKMVSFPQQPKYIPSRYASVSGHSSYATTWETNRVRSIQKNSFIG